MTSTTARAVSKILDGMIWEIEQAEEGRKFAEESLERAREDLKGWETEYLQLLKQKQQLNDELLDIEERRLSLAKENISLRQQLDESERKYDALYLRGYRS